MSQRKPPTKATGSRAGTGAKKSGTLTVNQRQTPWGIIATVAVVLFLAVVIISVTVLRAHDTTKSASGSVQILPSTPAGTRTAEEKPRQVANTTDVSGVLAWDTSGWPGNGDTHTGALEHQHVTGPVDYAVVPPVGGPHNATWMNAGVYTKPVPSERALHNLEHGAVWITYDPNLPKAEITALTKFVGEQSMISESQQASGIANQANRYVDLSPWATNTLPSPIVLSSWGYQLRITSPADPRMQQFVSTFRNSPKYSPEYGSAVDGIPVQTGGRPALDGSKQPNPAGSA
jgi:Protein of unknown function (DUF3105)